MIHTTKMSMRLTALSSLGGSLYSLYDSKRFDQPFYRSRGSRTVTKKDFRCNGSKNFRPWQYAKIKSVA
jgi:hypothetical protein